MENENLVSVIQFCEHHNIEYTFIHTLNEHELIELVILDNELYLYSDSIERVEKMMRLHFDLSINIEGIDVIIQLLEKIENLQEELSALKRS